MNQGSLEWTEVKTKINNLKICGEESDYLMETITTESMIGTKTNRYINRLDKVMLINKS